MNHESHARRARQWLERNSHLSPEQHPAMADLAARLADRVSRREEAVVVVGLAGAPGTGKTTLAGAVAACHDDPGEALVLSLDDYYLGRAERADRVRREHILFAQRGVPGTHDLERLVADLDRLRAGETGGLRLPRFDKSSDDRAPEAQWRPVAQPPTLVVLEGWCLGSPPQDERALQQPVNRLEAEEDTDGAWRLRVNQYLAEYATALLPRLAELWFLQAPDWGTVMEWRWQQEQELPRPALADPAAVAEFLARFQRIAQHMERVLPEWADVVIPLGADHVPGRPRFNS